MVVMTDLAQAQARILGLEAAVDRLTSEWDKMAELLEAKNVRWNAFLLWKDRNELQRINAAVCQDRDRLAGILQKANELEEDILSNCRECEESCNECVFATASVKAKAYQEAQHAG